MKNCVYRFLNKDNEIIYIGKAKDLDNRIKTHEHLPKECYLERYKIEFCEFETEDDMDFAERYFIPKYNPKYNTVFKGKSITIKLPQLDNINWELYKEYIKENELTKEELLDIRQIIQVKDLLIQMIDNNYINNKDDKELKVIKTSNNVVRKTFRVDAETARRWNDFAENNSEYTILDLMNTALIEFIEKYSN